MQGVSDGYREQGAGRSWNDPERQGLGEPLNDFVRTSGPVCLVLQPCVVVLENQVEIMVALSLKEAHAVLGGLV